MRTTSESMNHHRPRWFRFENSCLLATTCVIRDNKSNFLAYQSSPVWVFIEMLGSALRPRLPGHNTEEFIYLVSEDKHHPALFINVYLLSKLGCLASGKNIYTFRSSDYQLMYELFRATDLSFLDSHRDVDCVLD